MRIIFLYVVLYKLHLLTVAVQVYENKVNYPTNVNIIEYMPRKLLANRFFRFFKDDSRNMTLSAGSC